MAEAPKMSPELKAKLKETIRNRKWGRGDKDLDGMHYLLNGNAINHYFELYKMYGDPTRLQEVRAICPTAVGKLKRPSSYTELKTIHYMAECLGVPGEMLIRQDMYFKNGIAAYRLAFETYRQGKTIEEICADGYAYAGGTQDQYFRKAVWYLLKDQDIGRYMKFVPEILRLFCNKLGIQIGTLFMPPTTSFSEADQPYVSLVDNLSLLDKRQIVYLASMATVLGKHNLSNNNTEFTNDVQKLTGWYLNG